MLIDVVVDGDVGKCLQEPGISTKLIISKRNADTENKRFLSNTIEDTCYMSIKLWLKTYNKEPLSWRGEEYQRVQLSQGEERHIYFEVRQSYAICSTGPSLTT